MSIFAEYPLWLLIVCLALGVFSAMVLYYKSTDLNEASTTIRRSLAILRFLTVSLLAFLFISPFVERTQATKVKPLIVFAQDNSESVLMNKDSVRYKTEYLAGLQRFKAELAEAYDLVSLTFGDSIKESDSITFSAQYSDYDKLLSYVSSTYSNRNLGALIVAGDGIYNKGFAPEYRAAAYPLPIYTVMMGDSTQKKDLSIVDVSYNRTAFVDSEQPIALFVEASLLKGNTSRLQVSEKGKLVHEQDIRIDDDRFAEKIEFRIPTGKAGMHFFEVRLQAAGDEQHLRNNVQTIAIEVVESKEKVLILAHGAHPDVGAIKQAIQSNIRYQAEVKSTLDENVKLSDYVLLILYQYPQKQLDKNLWKRINQSKIARWYFVGKQTNMPAFQQENSSLDVDVQAGMNEIQANVNNNFNLFAKEDLNGLFDDTPPMLAPFGEYKLKGKSDVFLYQTIKGIPTQTPLMVLGEGKHGKEAVFVGEGIWRLRMREFRKNQRHHKFNLWINKTVQYLAINLRKDRFRITLARLHDEGRNIYVQAKVYNKTQELVNQADVEFQITDSLGNVYDFVLGKEGQQYALDLGSFPVGEYSYVAKALLPDGTLTRKGKFSVKPLNLESVNTVASPVVMRKVSAASGGALFAAQDWDALRSSLRNNEQIRPIFVEQQKLTKLAQLKFFFFILLILLTIEWGLRKFFGSY